MVRHWPEVAFWEASPEYATRTEQRYQAISLAIPACWTERTPGARAWLLPRFESSRSRAQPSRTLRSGNGGGNRSTPRCSKTTDLRAILPQIALRFLRIKAFRHPAEIHDAHGGAPGQKPGFAEDLDASVLIKGKWATYPDSPRQLDEARQGLGFTGAEAKQLREGVRHLTGALGVAEARLR